MTPRERTILILFCSAVLLLGGGGMFHLFFWKPWTNLRARMDAANKDIEAKKNEILADKKEIERAERKDPRLVRWYDFSLPESSSRERDKLEKHISMELVDYEKKLMRMMLESGFQSPTTEGKPVDARNVPVFADKKPIFTRLAYTIKAKADYESIVKMLRAFYADPTLHQVRDLKIRKPQLAGSGQRTQTPPGINPMGPPQAGPFPGLNPMGQPQPGFNPFGQTGRGGESGARALLDVTMTVEALIVTGAKTHEARGPVVEEKKPDRGGDRRDRMGRGQRPDPDAEEQEDDVLPKNPTPPVSILVPDRDYIREMTTKSIFFGLNRSGGGSRRGGGPNGDLTEDLRSVLGVVRLVKIEREPNKDKTWLAPPSIWRVEFWDQGTGKYHHCSPDFAEERGFEIRDRYGASVIKGAVVDANIHGIVIKVESIEGKSVDLYYKERLDFSLEQPEPVYGSALKWVIEGKVPELYYRMRIGDFFYDVTDPTLNDERKLIFDETREPKETYTRGEWSGVPKSATEFELAGSILKAVKLSKSAEKGTKWVVEFHDVALKTDYKCTPDYESLSAFTIKDRRGTAALAGNVVDGNPVGVVVKINGLFYKMKMGESFDEVLHPPLGPDKKPLDPERAPMKEYNKGDWKPPIDNEKKDGVEKR